MLLSVGHKELLAVLQLSLTQPIVFAAIVAPRVYKVLSGPSV